MQNLKEIQDKNPFKVPEDYFEDVNRKIISATSGFEQEVRKTGFYYRFRPYFLIAASVTGFIFLSYTAIKLLTPARETSQLSEVVYEGTSEVYLNDIDILSLEENAANVILSEEGTGANKKDIIDYLLLENIEINDIYEHL
jgi:hypothetical protein